MENKLNNKLIVTRDDFPTIINKLDLHKGVEIGVGEGWNAIHLMENTEMHLVGVDNWGAAGYAKVKEATKERLQPYIDKGQYELMEMTSMEASRHFEDGYFDFVYIDGDHRFTPVHKDLRWWYKKVRSGGFFGGHDYINVPKCGVVRAVNNFAIRNEVKFNLTSEINDGKVNKSYWLIKE